MPRDPDFWGQFEQEKVFPPGSILVLQPYRAPRPSWDHDHCIFCWAKFAEQPGPAILVAGYSTVPTNHEWVCPSCFEEFADRFAWRSG
jgi:hypothetical protein